VLCSVRESEGESFFFLCSEELGSAKRVRRCSSLWFKWSSLVATTVGMQVVFVWVYVLVVMVVVVGLVELFMIGG